ncbi:MAG: phosphatidate cytidylyltransferase [Anaerolineaceae bacterium]|nr:phosphatidate cytidylyltransferase [Anaerolineaceae bacterium]MBN2677121.1 phosphatidate cytidylyltransferase [Anaerolineaceae bacterium]
MLVKRLIVAIILIPIGVALINLGGWPLTLFIALLLGLAAWEYCVLFINAGYRPAAILVITGVLALVITRFISGFAYQDLILTIMVLAAMSYHLIAYEKGVNTAAIDFTITLGGVAYLGVLGAHLISLRTLPEGLWWFMLVMPVAWLADSGAYFIGSRLGKSKMAPRLSPNKSWEGYLGGILVGTLAGIVFSLLWGLVTPSMNIQRGILVGIVLSTLPALGDLGESMLKRQFGVKDSGNLLPGHGGLLDRMDSWIWAASIGYYLVLCLWIN